jgi:hypothetical protein
LIALLIKGSASETPPVKKLFISELPHLRD